MSERAGVREGARSSDLNGGTRTRQGMGTETHTLVITVYNARYMLTNQCVPHVKTKEITTRDDRARGKTKWGVWGVLASTWRLRREERAPPETLPRARGHEHEEYEVRGCTRRREAFANCDWHRL
jgi:hypothetical protein